MPEQGDWRTGFRGLVDFAHATGEGQLRSRLEPLDRSDAADSARPIPPEWMQNPRNAVASVEGDERITIQPGQFLGERRPPPHELGLDTLAYYLPFHIYGPDDWGIYIRARGIVWLSQALAEPRRPGDRTVKLAHRLLLEHERYHCVVEAAATKAEFVSAHPVYRPYLAAHGGNETEEAMCNASAFAACVRINPRARKAITRIMKAQPSGYDEFDEYLGEGFELGTNIIADELVGVVEKGSFIRPPLGAGFLLDSIPDSEIPTRLVLDVPDKSISVVKEFPSFNGVRVAVHSNDHLPPHFHLELPPGRKRGSFVWPSFNPDRNSVVRLSVRESKRLDGYMAVFGPAVEARIRAVYGLT